MQRLISFIRQHAVLSALVTIAVFAGTGTLMRKSGACLKTEQAPMAIVSFELAFTAEKARAIIDEWNTTICTNQRTAPEMAITNTYQDFLFVVGYTALLVVLTVLYSRASDQIVSRLVQICVAAGLLDCVENIFMLVYLYGSHVHPSIFGVFASAKFVLIVILLLNILNGIARRILPARAQR